LVVDDDGDVRAVIADILLDLGHRVSLAKDAAAMRAFLDTSDRVGLIVLDASADHEAASLAVMARERGLRLVMISGHPKLMEEYHGRVDQLLHKPFGTNDLRRAVQVALDSEVGGQRVEDPS
jgi:DNA-binding NtrC family response regulator